MNRHLISERGLLFLAINFIIGTAVMLIPPAVASEARQDAWLALLMGMLPSIVLAKMLVSLQETFPNQSLVQYCASILGRPVGMVVGGIVLWFALHISIFIVRNLGDFVQSLLLPLTPMVVIHVVIVILAAWAVRSGLEVITRTIVYILPVLLLFTIIVTPLTLPQSEPGRFLPFLENGFKPVIHGAIVATSFPFGEVIIFSLVLFQVNHSKQQEKFLLSGILIGFLFLILGIFRVISVLGVESSMRSIYPVLETIEEVPIGYMVVILLTLTWFSFAFGKLAICYYAFTSSLALWLGIKDYRTMVTPVGVIITALSILIYSNYTEEAYFAAEINPYYKIPIELGLPFLLWMVTKIRFKGRRGSTG